MWLLSIIIIMVKYFSFILSLSKHIESKNKDSAVLKLLYPRFNLPTFIDRKWDKIEAEKFSLHTIVSAKKHL